MVGQEGDDSEASTTSKEGSGAAAGAGAERGAHSLVTAGAGKGASGATRLGQSAVGAAPHRQASAAAGARLRARGLHAASAGQDRPSSEQMQQAEGSAGTAQAGTRPQQSQALLGAALTPGLRSLWKRSAAATRPPAGLPATVAPVNSQHGEQPTTSRSISSVLTTAAVGAAAVRAFPLLAPIVSAFQGPRPPSAPVPVPATSADGEQDDISAAQLEQAMDDAAQRWTQALQSTLPPSAAAMDSADADVDEEMAGSLSAVASGGEGGSSTEAEHSAAEARVQHALDAAAQRVGQAMEADGAKRQQDGAEAQLQQALQAMEAGAEAVASGRGDGPVRSARRRDAVPRMAQETSTPYPPVPAEGEVLGDAGLAPGVHTSVSETFFAPFKQLQLQPVQVGGQDWRWCVVHVA